MKTVSLPNDSDPRKWPSATTVSIGYESAAVCLASMCLAFELILMLDCVSKIVNSSVYVILCYVKEPFS